MATTEPNSCNHCKKTESELSKPLKRCAKCQTGDYCSRDCQKDHWKVHKRTCGKTSNSTSDSEITSQFHNPGFSAVNQLLGLSNNDYLHELSEKDAMTQLIDCFRMRCEDEHAFAGNHMGIYNEEDPRKEFKRFLDLVESRSGMLPSWWNEEKRSECLTLAVDKENWSGINCAVEKHDVQEHYEDPMMPMKLRVLGEKVYGKGFM